MRRLVRWSAVAVTLSLLCCPAARAGDKLSREDWGAMPVTVSHDGDTWTLSGKKQTLRLNAKDLSLQITAGPATWSTEPSTPHDLTIRSGPETFDAALSSAARIDVEPYDAGFKTGVRITLADFKNAPGLTLYLTLALEGAGEDLVFDTVATEGGQTFVRQLDWPTALKSDDIDATVLSNVRGVLLPRDYPKRYEPIRAQRPDGSLQHPKENSVPQSNVIEDWSMSWWGFQRGKSAMMVLVETPDDAAYQFDHPAGGPTRIGPRWRGSLGQLRYQRTCRFVFFPEGNYVTLAKHYRTYVRNTGLFVSIGEKIARNPKIKDLIGTPLTRSGILTDYHPSSLRYSTTQPEKNHRLTTFDQRAEQFKKWKAQGLDRLQVVLTGWPHLGYDRQHPDELPPAPEAGGWEGMKRLRDTLHDLGYLFALHDQYRDFYTDAPSWNSDLAVHEEDDSTSIAFPGSRFGQWKEGVLPFMNNWDGGKQSYLNNRLMPGHLKKNYTWLFDHGIHPDGVYLDVFGYVPPDEDFNPHHPTTRTEALNAHRIAYTWARNNIGFIGTEAGCDWTIPFTDYTSPLTQNKGIAIPLFNLVYHDAVMTPYSPTDLHGLLNAGVPQISLPRAAGGNPTETGTLPDEYLKAVKRMASLHRRLARAEMTNHEFVSPDFKKERTTFSDGTTVTVDWTTNTADIHPDLQE